MPSNNDKKIVQNAVIILILSVLIVYVIQYQTNKPQTLNQEQETNIRSISEGLIIKPQTNIITGTTISEIPIETNTTGQEIQEIVKQDVETGTDLTINTGSSIQQEDIIILSGTNIYFGSTEAIDQLGIRYDYILRDNKNIYFAYISSPANLASIARSLGGTLYTMNTETEISQNQLFGNRIVFINIAQYKDKIVLMYVEVGGETWLLQIPFSIYHSSKTYLQDLFTE